LRLGRKVVEVKADQVILAGEKEGDPPVELPADMVVWAAGIRVTDALAHLDGLESNRLNQLVVNKNLQTTCDADIFVLGDCASCVPSPGAKPVPPLAQAAHQEARFLARALRARLEGKALPEFNFHDRGSLVSLGHTQAVGDMVDQTHDRRLLLEGLIARVSYWALYRRHLLTLLGLRRTLLTLMSSWFSGKAQPRVKLH
jgi:NADH dehydrogenase